jgi:hypothetical protein
VQGKLGDARRNFDHARRSSGDQQQPNRTRHRTLRYWKKLVVVREYSARVKPAAKEKGHRGAKQHLCNIPPGVWVKNALRF